MYIIIPENFIPLYKDIYMSKKAESKAPGAFRVWVEYLFFLPPCLLVRTLSLKSAYRLAKVVAFFFYMLDFRHRKRAVTHILHSGIVADRPSAIALAKKNFLHMVKVFVEIIKFDQIVTPDNLREYVRDETLEGTHLECNDPAKASPKIITSMHLGNWELAANCFALYTKIPMTSIMRPLANQKIGNYFYSKRASSIHETVSKEKGIRPLLQAIAAKRSVAIVADQHASKREGVEVTFFGQPARAHMTPALLHLKTGLPILPQVLVREDDEFHFRLVGVEPIVFTPTGDKEKDIKAITQLYTDAFEKFVRAYPDQWLWAHRRWLNCGRKSWKEPDAGAPSPQ